MKSGREGEVLFQAKLELNEMTRVCLVYQMHIIVSLLYSIFFFLSHHLGPAEVGEVQRKVPEQTPECAAGGSGQTGPVSSSK